MKKTLVLFTFVLLGGCQTMNFLGGAGDKLNLQTDPPGALVEIEGVGSCETPCTIRLDSPQKARIAKAGFVTQYVVLNPSARKEVVVPLELAAASDEVDATALPELD
ncbi:PEGA domain-containing protein [Hyphococcus flavus]|uniref:PEGA domain-containing protein n=1 Tax=Hyphococcus flavus TaxID=1866326 RepID=A0AAE9ZCS8_9PROT|nr:PEGA domain-containing protein [Hyphococcus flavus]WDI31130.1 PEGA domain-containing protein [Hyphococcus flavus]